MRKAILIILDGIGHSPEIKGNAVLQARTPTLNRLNAESPKTLIATSGRDVGLPPGVMGNSEVGHLNIGAGRIVKQELLRISDAILDGEFFENRTLHKLLASARSCGRLHLLGLLSEGGVHASIDHLIALMQAARDADVGSVFLHLFTDGRDSSPTDGGALVRTIDAIARSMGSIAVGSVIGRYYAMDRDRRFDRTARAVRLLVAGGPERRMSIESYFRNAYTSGATDEFLQGALFNSDARIRSGDTLLFFNYRADRMRQIVGVFTGALTARTHPDFATINVPRTKLAALTPYDEAKAYPVLFPHHRMEMILADHLAALELSTLRIAETEKYAHVTYFFNGGREAPYPRESRILVASPKVATYDLKPEMSAPEVTDRLLEAMANESPDLIILNFANGDMVGHTGSLPAAIKAVEVVDSCLSRILSACEAEGRVAIVTADHGNCECMIDSVGRPMTSHTTNPVPLWIVDRASRGRHYPLRSGGRLADVAPTLLELMGLTIPTEMTGSSLLFSEPRSLKAERARAGRNS